MLMFDLYIRTDDDDDGEDNDEIFCLFVCLSD